MSVKQLKVNCTFINQPREGKKSCMIEVRPNCENASFTSEGTVYDSSFVEVLLDDTSMENLQLTKICFLLTGSNDTTIVNVEGQYTLSGKWKLHVCLMTIDH